MPDVVEAKNPSIKAKFGIDEMGGSATVGKVFGTLHQFIQAGGLKDRPEVINLGDWIDLEGGLVVAPSEEDYLNKAARGEISLYFSEENDKPKLRLIVVGINSFQSKGDYVYPSDKDPPPQHVVFHFQDIPGVHPMKATSANFIEYAKSEMRTYVQENFFTGLTKAGVPVGVLWRPARTVSTSGTDVGTLTDILWLPTEREMFGAKTHAADGETEKNQARLDYYTGPESRVKSYLYWLASTASVTTFCDIHTNGGAIQDSVINVGGCVPAFCVN
jgi:hypothetical protein